MAKRAKKSVKKTAKKKKPVEAITHADAKRKNLPTVELQSVVSAEQDMPIAVAFERRNPDLDPQLVWRGKDAANWSDLIAMAPPLYIQEKVHPKVLIDDLKKLSEVDEPADPQLNLFADFNGVPDGDAKTEFYQHDANWTNRMILGDSMQVMASLAEREELRGKVQCIYFDPPYGIKFNSNFQWSTNSRDVKDGKKEHITREPEQVKAFRDTWQDGIHSYLTYLRDRLTVARDLLTESGSIFVQIGDENAHRVRALMDEVFGEENFVSEIAFAKTTGLSTNFLSSRFDFLLWYGRSKPKLKFRRPYVSKSHADGTASTYTWIRNSAGQYRALNSEEKKAWLLPGGYRFYKPDNITSQGNPLIDFEFQGNRYSIRSKTTLSGLARLERANRIHKAKNSIQYVRHLDDFGVIQVSQLWDDTGTGGFTDDKLYVVQTGVKTIQRCILMCTDPGDLILDPTCGSGTTAYVAEQWGRRWITIDTSRVALALARARVMGARYPFYLLTDSPEGKEKEAELSMEAVSTQPTFGNIRHGFVNNRIPHIMLKSIANNTEIDVIYDEHQPAVEESLAELNESLAGHRIPFVIEAGGRKGEEIDFSAKGVVALPNGEDVSACALLEWEVPREAPSDWPEAAANPLECFWEARIARQKTIDASIAAKAEYEYLYDKPYEDKKKVRVAGPFTVESISPHRNLAVGPDGEIIDPQKAESMESDGSRQFTEIILENLKKAGVQQAHKSDKIDFLSLTPWPGEYICAEGKYLEGGKETGKQKRAGIFIGPEFGTVSRQALVQAVREAGDAQFDVVIACAFNFDAPSTEFDRIGALPVLKARMNADLHMAEDLKNTGKGNLFVIFGEPDIEIIDAPDDQIQVRIRGIDVFKPQTGEIVSNNPDEIACWFVDSDYDDESFFVRQAYFLGANDPYKKLRTTLKAEINEEAWETLHSDISRPFSRPENGRIAVKVINHLGDEAMKVFSV